MKPTYINSYKTNSFDYIDDQVSVIKEELEPEAMQVRNTKHKDRQLQILLVVLPVYLFFSNFSSQRKHQETIRHCVWLAGTFDMCDIICHTSQKFHIMSPP